MKKIRTSKRLVWLKHYLNESNPLTFLNNTEAAKTAGYKAKSEESFRSIGSANFTKLAGEIGKWLDEHGLSENALKLKLIELIEAKETKFFAHDGKVTDQRDVKAYGIQRQALDMAFKVQGSYAAEKHEVSGQDGAPLEWNINVVHTNAPESDNS